MPVVVHIPGYLREFTGGNARVTIASSPATAGAALAELWALHPGVRDRVVTEQGEVRPHVNVFVGTESIRMTGGLGTPLPHGAELSIIPAISGGADFSVVFAALRGIMARHAGSFVVEADADDRYVLAAGWSRKRKRHITAGGVEIRKNYVSYHLIPVYACPDLQRGLSPALRKRMQGKSCFNFTSVDPVLMQELERVTEVGFERFRTMTFD